MDITCWTARRGRTIVCGTAKLWRRIGAAGENIPLETHRLGVVGGRGKWFDVRCSPPKCDKTTSRWSATLSRWTRLHLAYSESGNLRTFFLHDLGPRDADGEFD